MNKKLCAATLRVVPPLGVAALDREAERLLVCLGGKAPSAFPIRRRRGA